MRKYKKDTREKSFVLPRLQWCMSTSQLTAYVCLCFSECVQLPRKVG